MNERGRWGVGETRRSSSPYLLFSPPRKCPAGVEPASPGWKPGASAARPGAHDVSLEAEAVGLEPTTDDSPAPAFEAGSSSSRMASVIEAAVAGIEPASRRLTAAGPYQHRPPGSEDQCTFHNALLTLRKAPDFQGPCFVWSSTSIRSCFDNAYLWGD